MYDFNNRAKNIQKIFLLEFFYKFYYSYVSWKRRKQVPILF